MRPGAFDISESGGHRGWVAEVDTFGHDRFGGTHGRGYFSNSRPKKCFEYLSGDEHEKPHRTASKPRPNGKPT
jgi:hypothetical protein